MTNTSNQSVAVGLYKCLKSVRLWFSTHQCRKSCRGVKQKVKDSFNTRKAFAGGRLKRYCSWKPSQALMRVQESLLSLKKKTDKVFFFILLLLGHTQSLSVCFGFISNSRVDGETLRTAIRISLTIDLCALLDQVLYTINRKRLISYIFSRWIFVTLRVIFPWNVPDWS